MALFGDRILGGDLVRIWWGEFGVMWRGKNLWILGL